MDLKRISNNSGDHGNRDNCSSVLLVDDEVLSQEIGKRLFGQLGYRVSIADNGIDGIVLCEKRPFDLLIIDYYLPDMRGDELARKIRSGAVNSDTFIIGMSNDPGHIYRSICMDAGMNETVEKPLTITLIKDLTSRYVDANNA